MAKKFVCSVLRDSYNPNNVDYTCITEITGDLPQLINDAVDHLLNDNITHSLDEHVWGDTPELRTAIEDILEEV